MVFSREMDNLDNIEEAYSIRNSVKIESVAWVNYEPRKMVKRGQSFG